MLENVQRREALLWLPLVSAALRATPAFVSFVARRFVDGAQPIAPRRRAQGRLRAYPRAMVWWRMFVLVFSLVLAGPLPVTAASLDRGLSTASGETTEPCHHEVAADAGSPACCAGHDLATHCRSAACAAGCAQLPVDPASALPPEVPVGKLPRAELPLPRGRCVAPEEPPPTA